MSEKIKAIQFMISNGMLDASEMIVLLQESIDGLTKNNSDFVKSYGDFYKKISDLEEDHKNSVKHCDDLILENKELQSQLTAEQEKVRKLKEALLSPKKDMRFITVLDAIEWKKFVDKTLKEVEGA